MPAEYRDRILARMVNVKIRNRPVRVKVAKHGEGGPASERGPARPFQKTGRGAFKGRAASRERSGGKGRGARPRTRFTRTR